MYCARAVTEHLDACMRPSRSQKTHFVLWGIVFNVISSLTIGSAQRHQRGIDMCEPIAIPMCMGMPYNMTRMPNHLHHSTQENARLAIEPYDELLKQNCSADLLFFLCAMFAPICTPQFQKEAIPPCRSVCERSRLGCEPLMNRYNFTWPADLNCDVLPEYDKGVCVSPEAIVSSMPDDSGTRDDKSVHEKKTHQNCTCGQRKKPSRKNYRNGKFDFAVAARINHVTHLDDGQSIVHVTINQILQRGKVHLQENKNMDLWTNSSCVCPKLRLGKDYLIIGEEDVLLNRLKYGDDTLVTRWNTKLEKKFKKWLPKRGSKKGQNRRCNRKGKCKKDRRRKSKTRCRAKEGDKNSKRARCRKLGSGKRKSDQDSNSLKKRKRNRNREKKIGEDNSVKK